MWMTLEGCLTFPQSVGLDNLRAGVTFHLVLGEGRRNKETVWGFWPSATSQHLWCK